MDNDANGGVTENDSDVLLSFRDMFDVNEIQKLQDAFSLATGASSIITEPNGRPITKASGFSKLCWGYIGKTESGLFKCMDSDILTGSPNPDEPVIQQCICSGLMNGRASIIVSGRHIANWVVGQIITDDMSEEDLLPYADMLGIDRETYREQLKEIPRMPEKKFVDICDYLFINVQMLSKYAFRTSQLSIEMRLRTEAEQNLKAANRQLEKWAEERTTLLEETNCELADLVHILEEEAKEREKSQKLYKELSLELENRVLQRTQELDQRNKMLDKANALFTSIYNSSEEVIVFALDTEYRYISFNENHRKVMKALWDQDIAVGMNMLNVIKKPEDAALLKRDFERALSGESFTRTTVRDIEDPSRNHWQNHWSPIIGPEDTVLGLTCFSLNITDRITAEENLAISEQLYSDIFHQSVIAVEVYNAEGILVDANEASLNLFGVMDLESLQGLSLFANPNLDYDMKLRLLKQETVHFTAAFDFSLAPYRTRHHGHRFMEWRIAAVVYKKRTTGYICQVQDVTDRRRFARTSARRPKWQL